MSPEPLTSTKPLTGTAPILRGVRVAHRAEVNGLVGERSAR